MDDIEQLLTGAIDLPQEQQAAPRGRRAAQSDVPLEHDPFISRVQNIWYLRIAGLMIFVGAGLIQNLSGAIKNSSRDMTSFWWQFGIMAVVLAFSGWYDNRLVAAVRLPFSGKPFEPLVADALEEAKLVKTRAQVLAERATGPIYFIALALALLITGLSLLLGTASISENIARFCAMLLVVNPATFSLAVGLISETALGRLAAWGITVRNREAFESLAKVDAVYFDKSGTLTADERTFVSALLAHGSSLDSTEHLIAIAAAVEAEASSSIGKAIVAEAHQRGLSVPQALDFRAIPGQGVTGLVENSTVIVGGPVLLTSRNIEINVTDLVRADAANQQGNTVVFVVREGELLGSIELADSLRKTAKKAVFGLQVLRKRVGILTGDATGVAKYFAEGLKITEVVAEVLPHQKAAAIESIQADGTKVAMVGEKSDDGSALTAADVSIAIDVAELDEADTVDISIQDSDPALVTKLFVMADRSVKKARQNLIVSVAVNVGALIVATGLFSPIGITLAPAVAVLLSCGSSIFVINNARLLRR